MGRAPSSTSPKSRKTPSHATSTVKKSSKKDSINLAKSVKQELINTATSGTTLSTPPSPPIKTKTTTYQKTHATNATPTYAPDRVNSAVNISASKKITASSDEP